MMRPESCYTQAMSTATVTQENRFVTATDWEGYLHFLEAVGEGRTRVTFDGTMVELMTPSNRHEYLKTILGMLLECYLEESGLDFEPGGQTTFKSALKKRGLEPDECYWIRSWREVLGGWDAETGPPPDLAIEVEVSRSVLDRLSIYAALGVGEVWRLDKEGELTLWALRGDQYVKIPESQAIANVPLFALNRFLAQAGQEQPASRLVRDFRSFLREQ